MGCRQVESFEAKQALKKGSQPSMKTCGFHDMGLVQGLGGFGMGLAYAIFWPMLCCA